MRKGALYEIRVRHYIAEDMRKTTLLSILLALPVLLFGAEIGTWKSYMAYHDVTQVERAGDMMFVLASDNLYSYNLQDKSIQTFDKAGALSDCGIATIGWSDAAQRLLIVYSNGNMDIMDKSGQVENLADFYNYSTSDDKTVNDVYISGTDAYLSTAFGVVRISLRNAEIVNTYRLGANITHTSISGGTIRAASQTLGKTYTAPMTANLLDPASWTLTDGYTAKQDTADPELIALAQTLSPGGPKNNHFGFLRFYNGKLYSVGCGYNILTDLGRAGCVQMLNGDDWTIYEDDLTEKVGGNYFLDINAVDVNPTDESQVFACGRAGVFEFRDGKFVKHYSYDNSELANTFANNKRYVVVQGLRYNSDGTLWLANSINYVKNLLSMSPDYTWTSHYKQDLQALYNLSALTFDSHGQLWMVNNNYRKPAVFRYSLTEDSLYTYSTFINEDGITLTPGNVYCAVEDKAGDMWIGTSVGVLVLEQSEFDSESPVFQQIKVPRNDGTNNADYLLSGIDVTCVAVDGGGRKWIGTNGNGVYLISEDNMTQVQHFTSAETPLLSDNVLSVVINDKTGEVYFGTEAGLCSYMSDATETVDEMNKDVTYAYPNPVRPDYTGPITIVGLTYNADVKIVTSSGALVAQGKSNGGSFIWDGCDTKGKRVASGVYMVETATSDGSKGTVCKIAIVR